MTMEIYISGLGGLGLINLTKKICILLGQQYPKVLASESRGIAQRRGSVSANIRAGHHVFTPQLYSNQADIIIALETLEALRQPKLIKPGTVCIVSDMRVNNLGGAKGGLRYPNLDEIVYTISKLGGRVLVVPYEQMMQQHHLLKVHVSSTCLAVAARLLGYSEAQLQDFFPELYRDEKNRLAITKGFALFNFDKVVELQKNVA
jgi:indolepyruvate ferredoxin oxidoreductase, beta subunit